ncbi:MAG: DUF2190 family protein [Roseburia sp.]|nr:DUF2190 family protein [Roseburia sp.]
MKAEYWQKGGALDYKNDTADTIVAGTVVRIQERIGIAGSDILPGGTGTLIVEGCFKMPKASGEAYDTGAALYVDPDNNCVTNADSEGAFVMAGYAAACAKTADAYAVVKLLG